MGLRSSVRNILRWRWVSVGDILKEVTDTFSIVGSSDSLGKHHTHVNHLEKIQSNLIQIPNIKNIIARMYGPRKINKWITFLPVSSHTQSCSYPAFKTNQSSSQRKKYRKTCGIVFVTTIASKELLFSRFNASPLNLQDDKYFNDSREKLTWKCRESR